MMEDKLYRDSYICPLCGKEEPFFKQIVDELKEKGRVPPDWNFWLDMKQGPVFPPDRMATLPVGSSVPAYFFATDICSSCGTVYVVRLEKTTGKTQLAPATNMPPGFGPNRQQRRHPGGLINPNRN